MTLFMLSILLYLLPVGILFYMALEIYFRNKTHTLNKITALLLLVMMALIMGSFLANIFPAQYYVILSIYLVYIPAFLLMGLVLHFNLRLTSRFDHLSRLQVAALCYTPTFPIVLILCRSPWISMTYTMDGPWKNGNPSFGLFIITLVFTLYIILFSIYLLFAGLRFVSQNPNLDLQKKQVHLILWALIVAGSCAVAGMFFPRHIFGDQFNLPDISSFAIIIFAIFVRFSMTRYSFLPPTERKYQILYELSPLAIVLLDEKAKIHDANSSAMQLFDISLSDILKRSFPSFLVQTDRSSFLKQFESVILGRKFSFTEYTIIQNSLEQRLVQAEGELIAIEGKQYQYIILRDITESRLAEQRIAFLAYHDPLTGLSNRLMFQQQLSTALAQSNEDQLQVVVMLLDLDRFKIINDTKGHHVGDLLLKHVANQLVEIAPDEMQIARLGGDEFAMFMNGIVNDEQIHQLAEKFLHGLRNPFVYENIPYYISASLGICPSPQFGNNPDTLLKYADIAMYFAKNNGRDRYQIYIHHLKHPDLDRFAMEARMRKALEQEEFILYYQPQMDMESGHIIGVEALIRWQNPEKGLVYPAEFIQIAEESGLIIPIGRWVLQKACEDMKKWIDSGLPEMVVSVNISLCQFIDNQFVAELKQILLQTELDPKLLCLEITESTAMENQEYSMEICQEIVEMNVRLSIDDFGTGYSSFSLLKYLKFDAIKIDRSFVQGIVMEEDDAEIIHAIIAMAHGLHQKVIAEGVEEKAQWDRLKTMGCDRVQGYYISKPVPESEWLAFVQQKTLV
ncbi:MAG: hypothetical protein JWM44_2375 [Bacilli bacterium]|nr:hypothetical protein [Bacilli bacterium]